MLLLNYFNAYFTCHRDEMIYHLINHNHEILSSKSDYMIRKKKCLIRQEVIFDNLENNSPSKVALLNHSLWGLLRHISTSWLHALITALKFTLDNTTNLLETIIPHAVKFKNSIKKIWKIYNMSEIFNFFTGN